LFQFSKDVSKIWVVLTCFRALKAVGSKYSASPEVFGSSKYLHGIQEI